MAKKRGNPNMRPGAPSVNPAGRGVQSRIDSGDYVKDGWFNLVSGVGTSAYDKRMSLDFYATTVDFDTAQELWRGDDVAKRSIEIPREDMLRQGFDFVAQAGPDDDLDTKEVQERVERLWKDLGVKEAFKEALGYEDAYGGSGILIGARDGVSDLSQPLNLGTVRDVEFLTVFDTQTLIPLYYYANPRRPHYGKPAIYQLQPMSTGQGAKGEESDTGVPVLIHESRLLIFPGMRVSKQLTGNNSGWGDSKFTAMINVLRDFNAAWDGTGLMIQNFGQEVIKMQGLAELIATDNGTMLLRNRLQAMQLSKSSLKALVLDSEDEWARDTAPLSGLSSVLQDYMGRMSSASGGIPVTKLFGISPGGLNSSGESDINQWDDRIKSMQEERVLPPLTKLTRILLAADRTKCEEWQIVFRALRQQTDKEKAETRLIVAQTDAVYINTGVASAEEIALSRFSGDTYSMETVIDFDDRAALESEMLAEQEAQALAAETTKQLTEPVIPSAETVPQGKEQ